MIRLSRALALLYLTGERGIMSIDEFIKKQEANSPLLKAWGNAYRIQETINARIELNKTIIKKGCDNEIQHDLEVENTALEFVLMLFDE